MNNRSRDRGSSLVLAMVFVFLMSALGTALAVLTSTELRISANYAQAMELRYVAEAALETVIQELSTYADWNVVLSGPAMSAFTDGPPGGRRTLADGSPIDLDNLTSQLADDHPVCRLFAFGPVQSLQRGEGLGLNGYVAVWIADDPEENPAMVVLRAEAFGGSGMRKMLEVRVLRHEDGALRVVLWHEVR
jgi:hypothetical protein